MTPGPNKRKAAKKKKKKAKPSKSSASTPDHSPRDGESDGDEISSSASNSQHNLPLPPVNLTPETKEDNPSATKSSTVERTEKDSSEKEGKSSSEKAQEKSSIPKSSSPDTKHHRDKKKSVVIEPAAQEKIDSVVTKMPLLDHKSNNNRPKETGLEKLVEKLVSLDDKDSPKANNCLTASTLNCPFCGRGGGGDRVKQHETPKCHEKHPLLSPNPRAPEKASWKSCCGLFELCSGSSR